MKSLLVASILGLMSSAAMASLLTNGTLETPDEHETNNATGWTLTEVGVDGAGAPLDTASFVDFGAGGNHTPGGHRGLWFRSFMGGLIQGGSTEVDAILTQAVAGSAGTSYDLSAWYRYETFYSGGDEFRDTQTILAIDFLDGMGGVLGSSELDIDALNANDGVWRQFSVSGIAPAGTASVQARASFLDGVLQTGNPQSAFVDDLVLTPEPTSLALIGLGALALIRRR